MALTLSWRPDRKPDSETLLEWYDRLDRQVKEIKGQMRRGVLGPQQVQAFIEHRGDIFPDAFWTIKSQGNSHDELIAGLAKKGWEFLHRSDEYDIREIPITAGATYHLVGIEARRFGPGSGRWAEINRTEIVAAAIKRGYRPVPQEAAIIFGGMYDYAEMGGYQDVTLVSNLEKGTNWRYAENGNVPHGKAVFNWYDLCTLHEARHLFVFAVDLPE